MNNTIQQTPAKARRKVDAGAAGARPYSDKFKGLWIDFALYTDPRFLALQKMLLAEIYALEKNGGCWASNRHFVPLLGVGERMVRKHITTLEGAGHIRSEGRTTKRRRLWISDDLRAQIENKPVQSAPLRCAAEPDTGQSIASSGASKSGSTGNDRSSQPGNDNNIQELEFLSSRNQHSTENTLRGQEKSEERNNIYSDFSLPDWLPASAWKDWVDYNIEAGRPLTPKQMELQIARLCELRQPDQPAEMIIEQAIEKGWKSFHPLPDSMKPKVRIAPSGARLINGMLVL